jgi:hypothetical protein
MSDDIGPFDEVGNCDNCGKPIKIVHLAPTLKMLSLN